VKVASSFWWARVAYGKTSILKTAGDRLVSDESAILLRYNAEGFTGTEQLVSRIVADAAAGLRAPSFPSPPLFGPMPK
jgi:hypothetical protein